MFLWYLQNTLYGKATILFILFVLFILFLCFKYKKKTFLLSSFIIILIGTTLLSYPFLMVRDDINETATFQKYNDFTDNTSLYKNNGFKKIAVKYAGQGSTYFYIKSGNKTFLSETSVKNKQKAEAYIVVKDLILKDKGNYLNRHKHIKKHVYLYQTTLISSKIYNKNIKHIPSTHTFLNPDTFVNTISH